MNLDSTQCILTEAVIACDRLASYRKCSIKVRWGFPWKTEVVKGHWGPSGEIGASFHSQPSLARCFPDAILPSTEGGRPHTVAFQNQIRTRESEVSSCFSVRHVLSPAASALLPAMSVHLVPTAGLSCLSFYVCW